MTPTDPGLARMELLREFKRRMPKDDPAANVSPFDARVSTAAGGPDGGDAADLHAEVRAHIRDAVTAVREGKKQSQVILLSGAAGVGKTHLLRTFRTPKAMAEVGHIFVGGSNHWTIGEFEGRLLDWVVEALTAPGPNDPHPLLDRIRAIGFRAVDHLLTNPVSWKAATARPNRWLFGRVADWLKRPRYDRLKALADARDPAVFRHFDFAAFSGYVCDRFLAERSNLLHRYALRVLLTYLFPDPVEDGVGTRERVLHWFRGRGSADYFTRRLGASERPDRTYSQFEAVKLFAHLFSPAVSAQLERVPGECPPRVLLLTFDQAEGRNELFDADDDWRAFFAHLSELYNTLPNVVVLFTMTLNLRNKLHAVMERQFRDRIRMDKRFTLDLPTPEQVKGLYRRRMESWLSHPPEVLQKYTASDNPYLPFGSEGEMLSAAGNQSVRDTFEALDGAFRQRVREVAVDAAIDYWFDRNEQKAEEAASSDWDYTSDHLGTVRSLLSAVQPVLADEAGVELREVSSTKLDNVPVLTLSFGLPQHSFTATVYLARLGKHYNAPAGSLVGGLLKNRPKAKTFLWMVRPQPLPPVEELVDAPYHSQVFTGLCSEEVESAFASLVAVDEKREKYADPGQRDALDELIRSEVGKTYLGQLFRHTRKQLDALASGTPAPELETTPV